MKVIFSFSDESDVIVDFDCGFEHCLAVSASGRVFAWGGNKSNHLGFLTKNATSFFDPSSFHNSPKEIPMFFALQKEAEIEQTNDENDNKTTARAKMKQSEKRNVRSQWLAETIVLS